MYLVVGLGNPGKKYENTRHNVGFLVVDRLAQRWQASTDKNQLGAQVGKALIASNPALLAKPQSFMNLSGQPVVSLRGYYKIENDDIVVVHDDVDLPVGRVKVKHGGGHGGHNGLRDLQSRLGTNRFTRVRVGIGRPPEGWDTAKYVLGRWDDHEEQGIADAIERAADATEAVLKDGVERAMNHFNTRPMSDSDSNDGPRP